MLKELLRLPLLIPSGKEERRVAAWTRVRRSSWVRATAVLAVSVDIIEDRQQEGI